ncbi:MAG: hypothetical protein ACMXX9_00840 [Candidatus Woesearchaeota archaeon]
MNDINTIEDEFQLEEIRSSKQSKKNINLLNQKNLSKWEMDELFLDDSYEEEF